MGYTPHLIAPHSSGLVNYYKPWLIGDDAFPEIEDAYVWRGNVVKRDGTELLAQIGTHINNAGVDVTVTAITNANPGQVTTNVAHNLVNGDIVTLQGVTGMTKINGEQLTITVTGPTTFTVGIDTSVSEGYNPYTGGGNILLPIQGLENFLLPVTLDEQLFAFTRYKAYLFNTTTTVFNPESTYSAGTPVTFSGNNEQFFWSTNYANSMWVANGVDALHFFETTAPSGWNKQRPLIGPVDRLESAIIVLPYKGRLVVLNTTETAGKTRFTQRARWSQIGTPYVSAAGGDPAVTVPTPFSTQDDAWRSDVAGKGGFIDADTSEEIISAIIVNDTMIVFFEKSTWRLRYIGIQGIPFVWERINIEFGSQATHATSFYNNNAFAYGGTGFIAADTNQVNRIDEQIPELAFDIAKGLVGEGAQRVQAVRGFFRQFIYWSYPNGADDATTPNKIAAYNLIEKSWSIFNQNFRTFGLYKAFDDVRWKDLNENPQDAWVNTSRAWNDPGDFDNFPLIVAGTTGGNVYIAFDQAETTTDDGVNYNFSIKTKRFNPYIQKGMTCRLEYVDLYCTSFDKKAQITADFFINDNDSTPALSRVVNTSNSETSRYTRVFVGLTANFHQIHLHLSDAQLADEIQGGSEFEMQGLVIWTREAGRIKDL